MNLPNLVEEDMNDHPMDMAIPCSEDTAPFINLTSNLSVQLNNEMKIWFNYFKKAFKFQTCRWVKMKKSRVSHEWLLIELTERFCWGDVNFSDFKAANLQCSSINWNTQELWSRWMAITAILHELCMYINFSKFTWLQLWYKESEIINHVYNLCKLSSPKDNILGTYK